MNPFTDPSDDPEVRPPAPGDEAYVDVAAVRDELGTRAARSGASKLVEQGVILVLSIGSTMVLARLLTPADFGVIAMVSTLTALVQSLKHFGLPMAAVHRDTLAIDDVDALFWLNLKLGAATFVLMAAMAPVLAWFYDEPRVAGATVAMALALVVLGLGAQHESLLMRQLRFTTLAVINVGATLIGFLVGIGAAWWGAGYWALVLQLLVTNALYSGSMWSVCRWRPRRSAAGSERLRDLLRYGKQYSLFSVIEHAGRNVDRVLIGYASGAAALGLYDNAFRWSRFPVTQIYAPLTNVAVSGLSRMQREAERFRDYFYRGALPVLTVTLPATLLVAVAARDVVLVLLGDQWLEAVPLLRLLAVAAFLRCFTKLTQWLYLAEGRTHRQLRWGILATPVLVGAVAAGVPWGAYGVAVGFAAASLVLTPPAVWYCLQGSVLTGVDFLRTLWRPALAAGLAACVVLGADAWLLPSELPSVVSLALRGGLFGAAYASTWLALPGGMQAAREVARLVQLLRGPAAAEVPSR